MTGPHTSAYAARLAAAVDAFCVTGAVSTAVGKGAGGLSRPDTLGDG